MKQGDYDSVRYALLVLGIVVLAVAGVISYMLYPRFDLPAVIGASLFVPAAAAGGEGNRGWVRKQTYFH